MAEEVTTGHSSRKRLETPMADMLFEVGQVFQWMCWGVWKWRWDPTKLIDKVKRNVPCSDWCFQDVESIHYPSIPGWCCLFLLETKKQKLEPIFCIIGCCQAADTVTNDAVTLMKVASRYPRKYSKQWFHLRMTTSSWTGMWAWQNRPDTSNLGHPTCCHLFLFKQKGQALGTGNGPKILANHQPHP